MNDSGNSAFLAIEITYGCNLRCPWCSVKRSAGSPDGVISPRAFERLMLHIKEHPYERYAFYGGEPLCYPRQMIEMMSHIRELQPEAKFMLFTNGTLLTRSLVDELNGWSMSTTVSLEGSGYKGIMNFIRHSPEPDCALDNLRALTRKSLRIVITREKLKNGGLAEDIAMLRGCVGNVRIEAALDVTDLPAFTVADIALYREHLSQLAVIMPSFGEWFRFSPGVKGRCLERPKLYSLADESVVDMCPYAERPASGCARLRSGLSPSVYDEYMNLANDIRGK